MKDKISIWLQSTLAKSISFIVLATSMAVAQEPDTEEATTEVSVEEVIVYGIRQSLETALAEKRKR